MLQKRVKTSTTTAKRKVENQQKTKRQLKTENKKVILAMEKSNSDKRNEVKKKEEISHVCISVVTHIHIIVSSQAN